MGLVKLTDKIYYLPHNPDVDRPMLAYIKGEKFALAIDAGYSHIHVNDFYNAISESSFKIPDFTVITHWHYDHTFGMYATEGTTIAHKHTNIFLKEQIENSKDKNYINILKSEDIHFNKEYNSINKLNIVTSDFEFTNDLTINLGKITAYVFHTVSPHSEDTTCIYIPEERVLFLGDSTSEDFFNNGYMDKEKLESLIKTIELFDCEYCILSHAEPLKKEELLAYLNSIK